MSKEDIKSLALTSRHLMHAYQKIITGLPECKKRAAEARARNLFPITVSHITALLNQHSIKVVGYKTRGTSDCLNEEDVKSLALTLYRLMFAYKQMIAGLSGRKKRVTKTKARKLLSAVSPHIVAILDQHGIKTVTYEAGVQYTTNYPMNATNADEFDDTKNLTVAQMLEPALIKNGQVLHYAKVSLIRARKKIDKTQ